MEVQALAQKGLKAAQESKKANISVLGKWGVGKEAKHVYRVTGEKSACGSAAYINFSLPDSC